MKENLGEKFLLKINVNGMTKTCQITAHHLTVRTHLGICPIVLKILRMGTGCRVDDVVGVINLQVGPWAPLL